MNTNTEIIKPPKEDIFKSGKFRSFVIQSIVMILVITFITWIINNTATNMAANGIAHGFDFYGKLHGLILDICHLLNIQTLILILMLF